MTMMQRPRRLRRSPLLRDMAAETTLSADNLMMPHFVIPDGSGHSHVIDAMPGINRVTVAGLVEQVGSDLRLGINKVMLFALATDDCKDGIASASRDPDGLFPQAIRALKHTFGESLMVATDVCLCPFTHHGHCGVVAGDRVPGSVGLADMHATDHVQHGIGAHAGEILNDVSLPLLAEMALIHARAGADMVAPSDMMDGRVGVIRHHLDQAGYSQTAILSHTTKYASAYYGPFREAAGSAPGKGDRKGYQMDPRNRREALRELALDEAEGADVVMVKPALAYLDVIAAVRAHTTLPVACYNVSAEYAMVKAAAQRGWINEAAVVRENLYAMRRAGADLLVTYHARDALASGWLD